MLEEMRRTVRDASLIVKNLFNQFDLHGRGCISAEQFLRVVSCHGLLSADKVWIETIAWSERLIPQQICLRESCNHDLGTEAAHVRCSAISHSLERFMTASMTEETIK